MIAIYIKLTITKCSSVANCASANKTSFLCLAGSSVLTWIGQATVNHCTYNEIEVERAFEIN